MYTALVRKTDIAREREMSQILKSGKSHFKQTEANMVLLFLK